MVDIAFQNDRDGFKATVRMSRKARHMLTMIHLPALALLGAVFGFDTQATVTGGIMVDVVNGKQKRVQSLPRRGKGLTANDALGHEQTP